MAKPSSAKTEKPAILPVPALVAEHHGRTLSPSMKEWMIQERIPPVLLLTGVRGVGKRTMAYHFAQWVLCEARQEKQYIDAPCGQCHPCLKALSGSWVDFTEITPEEEDGAYKIDQFRKLKSSLGFGAHESRHKITLIANAERMTLQAANSLLKLLEEPPSRWIFLLTASDPTLLLPTIISRCQAMRLKPFSSEQLSTLLQEAGVSGEKRKTCVEFSGGSWGKALALAGDEIWDQRKLILGFFQNPGASVSALVDWGAQEARHFDFLVDQLEQTASELVRSTLGAGLKSELEGHAKATIKACGGINQARDFWVARAERLAQARGQAHAPVNRKILIQDLLLPWLSPGA